MGGGDCLNCPINTMPAFESAVNNLGLHWIETDPQLTKDGVFVLFHDSNLSNYTNIWAGQVSDYTYEELLKIDFGKPDLFGDKFKGTKICTADEAIKFCKKNNVILEFDFGHFDATYENIKRLWDLVCENNYQKGIILESYDVNHLQNILRLSKSINVIHVGCDESLQIPNELYDFDFAVVALNYKKVGDEIDLAKKIHAFGFKAASSVINPVPENPVKKMNELFSFGFDFIYADSIPYSSISNKD